MQKKYSDKDIWNERYKSGHYNKSPNPHRLLEQFWEEIPKDGPIVDIAAGSGRNLFYLAGMRNRGLFGLELSSVAIDIVNESTFRKEGRIDYVQGDARDLPFKKDFAAAVLVFYFFLRHSIRDMMAMLQKKGLLIYETYLLRQNSLNHTINPDYLLDDGELLDLCGNLDLVFYEEVVVTAEEKKKAIVRYVGRKR